jgi:hypothetical protein
LFLDFGECIEECEFKHMQEQGVNEEEEGKVERKGGREYICMKEGEEKEVWREERRKEGKVGVSVSLFWTWGKKKWGERGRREGRSKEVCVLLFLILF